MERSQRLGVLGVVGLALWWTEWGTAEELPRPPVPPTDGSGLVLPFEADSDQSVVADGFPEVPEEYFPTSLLRQPAPPLAPIPSAPQESLLLSGAPINPVTGFPLSTAEGSLLRETRRREAMSPSTDIVLGSEGKFRISTDGGSLLGKSTSARGVATQSRSPIVNDPRIRGDRTGRLMASGSYWVPARQDLDTALSKLDSREVENLVVIKGPYSAVLGPGFDFVDFRLQASPRYEEGSGWNGSSVAEYQGNGNAWYGREAVWGGGTDYGFRVSYGHRTGNDYFTGNGDRLPSSYNSRDLVLTFGKDLTEDSSVEFNYLRQDQTGLEFPGLVFDINYLVMDGFDLRYRLVEQPYFDELEVSGWYNRTRFEGDTARSGKLLQIPSLGELFAPFDGTGRARTDVDSMSAGYRELARWGDPEDSQTTLGTDLIFIKQELNDYDIDPSGIFGTANFPIPRSDSTDVGLFFEQLWLAGEATRLKLGGRVDFIAVHASDQVQNFFDFTGQGYANITQMKEAGLDQNFTPWGLFTTAERELSEAWTLSAGAGYAERPPTLTELYASGSFIGTNQPGLTFLEGDPELDPERRLQLDLGLRGEFERTRVGVNGYYAWIRDYITYDYMTGGILPYRPGFDFQHLIYTNTDLATLGGFEAYLDRDVTSMLTGFARISFVEGRDHTRNESSRLAAIRRAQLFAVTSDRSGATNDDEPLPGIVPLQSSVGVRWHQDDPDPDWGLELEAVMVAPQNRVATSLVEKPTAGYGLGNVRGFWRPFADLTMMAGVENFTDRYYRQHLDYRSGRGVYQPGINAYLSAEVTY